MHRRVTVVAAVLGLLISTSVFQPSATAGSAPRPAGVTWDGHHFSDRKALGAWLGRHGVRYRDWARRHPRGAYLMTHAVTARAATTRTVPSITVPEPTGNLRSSEGSGQSSPITTIFLVLAVVLLAVAAAFHRMLTAVRIAPNSATVASARAGIAAAGIAVGLAAVVVHLA